jgi:HTH-type transcriptional regulator, glycine betaine synthesis regulator
VTRELSEVEILVGDTVGRLIEFWGFKRNMGRLWSILYLDSKALSAEDLKQLLQLSSGAISMLISDLERWGVVRRVWVQGERRDFYVAETDLWKMVSRVLSERESVEVSRALAAFQRALDVLDADGKTAENNQRRERVRDLMRFAELGQRLLDFVARAPSIDPTVLLGKNRVTSVTT